MDKSEIETIRNVIARLKNEARVHPAIDASLNDSRLQNYLSSWVFGALECLLPESRDLKLALDLSRPSLKDESELRAMYHRRYGATKCDLVNAIMKEKHGVE